MLDTISRILFIASSSALVPVMVALLVLAGWTLLLLGGLIRESAARVSTLRVMKRMIRELADAPPGERLVGTRWADVLRAGSNVGFLPRYVRACWLAGVTVPQAEKQVDDIELEMARRVSTLSVVARLGPMLGLAGTLIPLGPGLVDLARGDTAGLANQLVIAFSTTVVGLLIGMVAFACAQVRRGWYASDLSDVLFLEELRRGQTAERDAGKTLDDPAEEWSMPSAR